MRLSIDRSCMSGFINQLGICPTARVTLTGAANHPRIVAAIQGPSSDSATAAGPTIERHRAQFLVMSSFCLKRITQTRVFRERSWASVPSDYRSI